MKQTINEILNRVHGVNGKRWEDVQNTEILFIFRPEYSVLIPHLCTHTKRETFSSRFCHRIHTIHQYSSFFLILCWTTYGRHSVSVVHLMFAHHHHQYIHWVSVNFEKCSYSASICAQQTEEIVRIKTLFRFVDFPFCEMHTRIIINFPANHWSIDTHNGTNVDRFPMHFIGFESDDASRASPQNRLWHMNASRWCSRTQK